MPTRRRQRGSAVRRADRVPCRRQAGFTLVEMLVTLVVVATVSTLLWQALALTARLEQSLARAQQDGRDVQLRDAWLRLALDGLAVTPGNEEPLRGTARRLTAVTTAPPWPGSPGPEAFALELRPETEPGDDGTVPVANNDGSGPLRLWALRPATGETFDLGARAVGSRFEYLDGQGQWLAAWPPAALATQADGVQRPLPRAVRLAGAAPAPGWTATAVGGPASDAVLVAPQATRNPMLSRRQAAPPDDTR